MSIWRRQNKSQYQPSASVGDRRIFDCFIMLAVVRVRVIDEDGADTQLLSGKVEALESLLELLHILLFLQLCLAAVLPVDSLVES